MGGAGGCLVLNAIGKSGLPPFLIVILGILGALVFSMLCGLIYSFLTVSLRANQNVTGLALTTFGVGLMKVLMIKLDATIYLVGPHTGETPRGLELEDDQTFTLCGVDERGGD